MAKRAATSAEQTETSDADLTLRAAKGDTGAFEELYRRHSEAAWRVAYAVSGNPHDASDAVSEAFTRVFAALPAGRFPAEAPFRPYLLTATRNAAIDGIRRSGKLQPRELAELDIETAAHGPSEKVVGALDSSLVATAFLSLPERWRSVLWLTEVEGLPPREIGQMLGISANGAAQLAVRARNGLRDHFLQAHLRGPVDPECKFAVDHLGAYVGGALSARDVAKVDQHLTGCAACRARHEELEDIGTTLRKIALPLPLALGGIAAARWKLAATAASAASHSSRRALGAFGLRSARAVRPLAVAAGLTLALGIIGAAVVNPNNGTELGTKPRHGPTQTAGSGPVVSGFTVAPPVAASAIESVNDVAKQQAALDATPRPSSSSGTQPQPAPSKGGGGGGSTAPPAPAQPVLQVSVVATPAPVGVVVGDACTGADLGGAIVGCPPPAPSPTAVIATVQTGGQVLGDNTVPL